MVEDVEDISQGSGKTDPALLLKIKKKKALKIPSSGSGEMFSIVKIMSVSV